MIFPPQRRGFTLIEIIVTIVIIGIVAAIVMVFIRAPIQSYFSSAQRAELTAVVDSSVRRIARDLRQALPNSVRVSNGNALEFMSVRTAGRYRSGLDPTPGSAAGPGDFLDFTQDDATFDILGPPIKFFPNDRIVIYNLGPSTPGSDAYANGNSRNYAGTTSVPTASVTISPATFYPFESPSHRFFVVDTPVTYLCQEGVLWRYWNYDINPVQPNPPDGGNSSKLAEQNTACTFTYEPSLNGRLGLVSITLAVTLAGETVQIHREVHVTNTP